MHARLRQFVRLLEARPETDIAVVTHGVVLRTLLSGTRLANSQVVGYLWPNKKAKA